jgi:hypothetical protein
MAIVPGRRLLISLRFSILASSPPPRPWTCASHPIIANLIGLFSIMSQANQAQQPLGDSPVLHSLSDRPLFYPASPYSSESVSRGVDPGHDGTHNLIPVVLCEIHSVQRGLRHRQLKAKSVTSLSTHDNHLQCLQTPRQNHIEQTLAVQRHESER